MDAREQARKMNADEVVGLIERNADLERQLDWLKRQIFGSKSEKLLHVDNSQQPTLGEGVLGEPEASVDESTTVAAHTRRAKKPSREPGDPLLRFDDDVPVQEYVVVDPALEGVDPSEYAFVDYKVKYLVLQNPTVYTIVKLLRPVVKMKADGSFSCPPVPAQVFEGSYADPSFLANLAIDKCRYHLPLYRQHQRLEASGIHIDRGTLTRYVQRMSELLAPIVDAQLRSILQSKVLAIDETPIKAGRKAKGKMKQGYIWPVLGDQQEIVFHFAPSRGREVVERLLGDFAGTLVNDGYKVYESYCVANDAVVRAQCWVHARRQFVKAEAAEPELVAAALQKIGQLYELEGSLGTQATDDAIQELRGERMRPLVEDFFAWLRENLDERALLPSSPFNQAAHYVLERRIEQPLFCKSPQAESLSLPAI